jgi:glycosyltransferase involved in cell wall biosynthesis
LRVLVVTAWPPWRLQDGGSLILYHELRLLGPRHEVRVLSAGGPPGERPLAPGEARVPEGVEVRSFGTKLPRALDHALRRLRSRASGEPPHVLWVERPSLLRALARERALRPPDLVHLHGWGTAQMWRLLAGTAAVHHAVDAWGLGHANRALPPWRRPLERRVEERIVAHERRHYPRLAAVLVAAERDAAYLRERAPGSRVEVIPNGVDAGPEPGPPAAEPVLAFHGAFETAANREAALVLVREVFPLVRAARPDARVILVGRDPPPALRRLAGDGVTVTGAVTDVRPWLERAAVYVAPMVSGTGIKNKVLEAMAAGLPVVGTPAALEGIGAGPGTLEARTPAEVAAAVLRLLDDAAARRDAGRRARQRVLAEHTWERHAARLEALWIEVAAAHAARRAARGPS